jgi:hypothetical protein
MSKEAEDRPYGNNRAAYHQVVSQSDECDSLGGRTKHSQKVDQNAPAVAHPHRSESAEFDERLPQPKGAYPSGHTTLRSVNGAKSKGPVNHLKTKGY